MAKETKKKKTKKATKKTSQKAAKKSKASTKKTTKKKKAPKKSTEGTSKTKKKKSTKKKPKKASSTKKSVKKADTKVSSDKKNQKDKFAVIKIAGAQLKVYEGAIYELKNLKADKGDEVEVKDVLLVSDDGDLKVGTPNVKGASVKYSVVARKKGKKINGFVYKAKSRYRRRFGSRPMLTKIQIDKISA